MGNLEKINEGLYYDERSAGGIVYQEDRGKIRWLVVIYAASSKARKKQSYKFPKGHLREGEYLKQAAIREVEEEGKVRAEIVTKLGSKDYIFRDRVGGHKIIKKVTFFLMGYEGESRLKYYDHEVILGREWLTYEEAMAKLSYDSEKVLLKIAKGRLESLLKRQKRLK